MATIKLSEDKELVNEIRARLKENKEKYGKPYCPCVLPTEYTAPDNDKHVCMCKEFREQDSGECSCGLYYKV